MSEHLPHDADAERDVIGSVLIDRAAFDAATASGLTAEAMYTPAHAAIWRALAALVERDEPVEITTVEAELRAQRTLRVVGGIQRLTEIQLATATGQAAGHHARAVVRLARARSIALLAASIAEEARGLVSDSQVPAWLDEVDRRMFDATRRDEDDRTVDGRRLLDDTVKRAHARANAGTALLGIGSGYPDLDAYTFGWRSSKLIVLAARPGVGKSALATNILLTAARSGHPGILFSVEMDAEEIGDRIVASEGRLNATALQRGHLVALELEALDALPAKLASAAPWCVDDAPTQTVARIRAKARRFVALARRTHDALPLVIVDYLQLVRGTRAKGDTREAEVASVSRGLKALAKDLRAPVIALAQLRRDADNAEPTMGHLRESGAIEADADVIVLMHKKNKLDTTIHLHVAKHRGGPVGSCDLEFIPAYTRFESSARGGSNGAREESF